MISVPNADDNNREELRGLECPHCGCFDSVVIDTRKWFRKIRRTRQCNHCQERWHTNETPATTRSDVSLADSIDTLLRQFRR